MQIHNWEKLIDFCTARLGYTIEGKQEEIIKSQKSVKVVRAARRTGKSFSAALIAYALLCYSKATNNPLNIIFGGPRAIDVRHIHDHLHRMLEKTPIQEMTTIYDNYSSPSVHRKKMIFENGTEISTASLDSPDMEDIRGSSYDLAVIDEYGAVDYKQALMDAVSQSLKDAHRLNQLIIIGSPDLGMGEEFDRLVALGQTDNPKIQSWHLTEADCPFLDKDSAETMNSLLDDEGRLREVEGQQIPQGGRLFAHFHVNTQVIPQIYNPALPYFIGIDFGRNKPVVEFVQPVGDEFHIFYEIPGKNILIENLITDINMAVDIVCDGHQPMLIGCDKAGASKNDLVSWTAFSKLKESYPMARFTTNSHLVKKDNQTRLYCKLTNENKIFIDPGCRKLIASFLRATPNKSGQMVKPGWLKVEGLDDPLDALMYGIINFNPGLIISRSEGQKTFTDQQLREFQSLLG